MLNDDVLTFPDDNQVKATEEPSFVRYVRSTLNASLREQDKSNLSLGGHGEYDILTLPAQVVKNYQWRSIYCRPTRAAVSGTDEIKRGLLCIGEAIGGDLCEVMHSAGLGTRFMVIGSSEYLKMDGINRRGWVFNPLTTPIDCQLNIGWSAATPNWQSFDEAIEGMRVLAMLRS